MTEIRITKDGPYHVLGNLPLALATIGTNFEGESVRWDWGREFPQQERYRLCRCGHSANRGDERERGATKLHARDVRLSIRAARRLGQCDG
jgi:hypothetical protein